MAKSNASTAPWPRNGRMRKPITATKPEPRHMLTGCTTIITTDPTPASQAQRPPNAFTTSRGITAKLPYMLKILPGLAVAFAGAGISWGIAALLAPILPGVSALLVAILAGVLWRNIAPVDRKSVV